MITRISLSLVAEHPANTNPPDGDGRDEGDDESDS